VKQVFRLLSAASACVLVCGLCTFAGAQTLDRFVTQVTSSANSDSFAGDISGDGRFAVIESTGDIATTNKNNADGNREIFLFDYAQRRIFQITNTKSALVDATKPAIDTTKSPPDFSNTRIEVSNNKPVISHDGRFIVFSSNAPTPASFDGNAAGSLDALNSGGANTEIFIYQIPRDNSVVNLSSGAEAPFNDLSKGTFTQITSTPASRVAQAGSATRTPSVADDNRDPAVNENGSIIAFVSTRNNPTGAAPINGATNADGNPEIFVYNRLTNITTQLTNTQGTLLFNENPSLSDNGLTVAYISNANIPDASGASNNSDSNAEIYVARLTSGGAVASNFQVTRTTASNNFTTVNVLSPGRRLSRDGNLIAFESTADLTGSGAIQVSNAVFVYNIAANSFTQFSPRAASSGNEILRFPVFTDYNAAGTPDKLIFASRLTFRADGSAPPSPTDSSSLNPNSTNQLFSVRLAAPNAFTVLTNTPNPSLAVIPLFQQYASDSQQRLIFTLNSTELGGGNSDNSAEVFYLLTRTGTDASGASAFFTGLSGRSVTVGATAPALSAFAPGMIGLVTLRGAAPMPMSSATPNGASAAQRRPSLPFELGGVTLSINGAAAGLYSVTSDQINFVVPPGLAPTSGTNTYNVVINNNGSTIRSQLQIVSAQPDLGVKDGTSNRAAVFNVTGGMMMMDEPPNGFSTTTAIISSGQTTTVPTVLGFILTGVRNAQASQITVTIGTTDITGASIKAVSATDTPGFDEIDVEIPASLAGLKNQPVVIKVGGTTVTSRTDTPPLVSFQ
jgi:uncharacterized protein (TIGR03437 family)